MRPLAALGRSVHVSRPHAVRRSVAAGLTAAVGLCAALLLAGCDGETQSQGPPDTCSDPPCDDTCASPPCDDTCTNPPCDDTCTNPPCDDPAPLAFQHVPITIDDPVVNGTSLMMPVDGIAYAHDGQDAFVTAFGRDFNDPSQTFLWHLDEATGSHSKKALSGQVFAQSANLCVDEDWCQLIGFDNDQWVFVGPAASSMMRVSSSFDATLSTVSGPQPAASLINHSHRFSGGELFLYGATGPSGFADTAFALTLSSGTWRQAATGLSQTDSNCLAFDSASNTLYSVGGRTTTDGGETTQTLATFTAIDVVAGTHAVSELPAGIGARQGMSCAFDAGRGLLYAYGGAVVQDRFNDALNQLFNDLWIYDVAADSWTRVIEATAGGMLDDPDQYGDQSFVGDPSGPNFGRNRGHMAVDPEGDRVLLIGAVPVFTHEQLYVLPLDGIEQRL